MNRSNDMNVLKKKYMKELLKVTEGEAYQEEVTEERLNRHRTAFRQAVADITCCWRTFATQP